MASAAAAAPTCAPPTTSFSAGNSFRSKTSSSKRINRPRAVGDQSLSPP